MRPEHWTTHLRQDLKTGFCWSPTGVIGLWLKKIKTVMDASLTIVMLTDMAGNVWHGQKKQGGGLLAKVAVTLVDHPEYCVKTTKKQNKH